MRICTKKSIALATILLMTGPMLSSAHAIGDNTAPQPLLIHKEKKLTSYEFSEGISVVDAYKYGSQKGHSRFSIVYENGELGGGKTLENLQQAQEFQKSFEADHAVEPRTIRIEILSDSYENLPTNGKNLEAKRNKHKVDRKKEGFAKVLNNPAKNISKKVETEISQIASDVVQAENLSVEESNLVSVAATAPRVDTWSPEWVKTQIVNRPSSVVFAQDAQYDSNTRLSNIESGFGVEMEVNLHADPSLAVVGTKPFCNNVLGPVDTDTLHFAKNDDYFNYNLYVGGGDLSQTRWYLDYNDATDDCNLQSIALGIVEPQKLTTNQSSGVNAISWNIETPKGGTPKNTVSSVWQLIENGTCLSPAGNLMNPTDCMGLNVSRNPSQEPRQVASQSRNLKGPSTSWSSSYHGHFGGVKQAVLVSSSAPIAGESQLYLDIDSKNSLYHSLKWAKDRKVVFTNTAVNFNMHDPMRRDLLAVYLYRLMGSPSYPKPTTNPANDVTTTQSWSREISWAISRGYLTKNSAGNFRPGIGVSRAELANAMYKAAGSPAYVSRTTSLSSDVPITHPNYKAIDWGIDTGVLPSPYLGTYQPSSAVSRADVFFTIYAFGHR